MEQFIKVIYFECPHCTAFNGHIEGDILPCGWCGVEIIIADLPYEPSSQKFRELSDRFWYQYFVRKAEAAIEGA